MNDTNKITFLSSNFFKDIIGSEKVNPKPCIFIIYIVKIHRKLSEVVVGIWKQGLGWWPFLIGVLFYLFVLIKSFNYYIK